MRVSGTPHAIWAVSGSKKRARNRYGLYARRAQSLFGYREIWAEDVFVSRPDGSRLTTKGLRLMPILIFFDGFKDYGDGPLLRMLGRGVVSR